MTKYKTITNEKLIKLFENYKSTSNIKYKKRILLDCMYVLYIYKTSKDIRQQTIKDFYELIDKEDLLYSHSMYIMNCTIKNKSRIASFKTYVLNRFNYLRLTNVNRLYYKKSVLNNEVDVFKHVYKKDKNYFNVIYNKFFNDSFVFDPNLTSKLEYKQQLKEIVRLFKDKYTSISKINLLDIIKLKFKGYSTIDIADKYNVTPEAISYIINNNIRNKLKKSKIFKDYL